LRLVSLQAKSFAEFSLYILNFVLKTVVLDYASSHISGPIHNDPIHNLLRIGGPQKIFLAPLRTGENYYAH